MDTVKQKLPEDYIPKKDTQQEEFLQNYPIYDGRGLKIAIIDSGVDVSLDGLQKTSTGLPKIIDCFDFTDAGDVDTSTIKRTGKNRILTLLSGRKVQIPETWKNESNKWHLGIKPLYEFCPQQLDKNEREIKRDDNFLQEQKTKNSSMPWKAVKNLPKKICDNENVDCIVWNDGQKFEACLLLPTCEHLENAKILTNFQDEHEYCFVSEDVACCVTICKNGNLLKICIPTSDHGSCVAQIAAAHFPNQPKNDGLAPGAQIVSMIVLENPTDSSVIEKAILKCIELKVDIVNFSLVSPEFSKSSFIDLIKKMVNEHGIIVTKSAGNYGPFFSSIGDDTSETDDEILTIGAIFTKYTLLAIQNDAEKEDRLPLMCNYSSKGPLPNGCRGVTLVAPANALLQTSKWHPSKKSLFNGTSSAAPNVAGAIACLLSGLKANSITYSPAMIKMALSNTALLPDGADRLGFGNGIIQINSAFEYLKTFNKSLPKTVFPRIYLNGTNKKGIVIHKKKSDKNIYDYCISIVKNFNIQSKKEVSWILKLSSGNHEHVEHSKTVKNNLFNVKIDTTNLKPGNIYYSEIHGFDPSNLSFGPIFHLPIIVTVPENVENYCLRKTIFFQPISVFYLIADPPEDGKKCMVKIINSQNGMIEFQKILVKSVTENAVKANKNAFFPTGSSYYWRIDITWKKTFEICIYQHWFVKEFSALKRLMQVKFDNK